jgi:uncharacterized protein YndB with AHSA1/START domain
MDGRLEDIDGRWRLRFTRQLAHPRERVWRAVTQQEHLAAWFPQRIRGAWAAGAELTFSDPQGRGPDFTGKVLMYQPPSLVEFSWGTDVIRLELAEHGDGCTLTLIDMIDEIGKAARDAAGWHTVLDRLEHHLDGTDAPWSAERWRAVHAGYVVGFGKEASVIGPPGNG